MDPITYEILRHRLWMINDEQGKIAVRISGSPLVYDVKDFSASLLTAEGDSLFIGPHITRLSMALHAATKSVLRDCEAIGFNDGDMFFTNDPWAGVAHQNDQAVLAPVVWQGEVMCWTGICMHDIDVGGPTFGGYSIRAADAFSEAPIVPPIRIVERGDMRPDLERLLLRNSRTPELNALNLRSRIAAQNVARERIFEIIHEYGREALLETQRRTIDSTKRAIRQRLAELPDGCWRTVREVDHDGFENRIYKICLAMTKRGSQLTFDFSGTDKQAPGTINCAPGGLEGGVYSAILPMLCYDMAWCPAAIQQAVEIVSEPGTLNNATFPAAVGTASVSAIWATGDAVRVCLAQMLACSDKYREEAQASWAPGLLGTSVTGASLNGKRGRIEASIRFGGAGATATHDGLDAGGNPGSPTLTLENIEGSETHNPIGLILYRKIQSQTAGAGKYRGGGGLETMIVSHNAAEPLLLAQYSQGHDHPLSQGLCGGYPGSVQGSVVLRRARWAAGDIPVSLDQVEYESIEVLPAKGVSQLGPSDAFISWCGGGSGYGDPLERDAVLVAEDVCRLAITGEQAAELYGVVVAGDGCVDSEGTRRLRQQFTDCRLSGANAPTSNGSNGSNGSSPALSARRLMTIGDGVEVVAADGGALCRCVRCGHVYGPAGVDPQLGGAWRDRPLVHASPLNRFAASGDKYALREVFCPGCGLLIGARVHAAGEPLTTSGQLAIA